MGTTWRHSHVEDVNAWHVQSRSQTAFNFLNLRLSRFLGTSKKDTRSQRGHMIVDPRDECRCCQHQRQELVPAHPLCCLALRTQCVVLDSNGIISLKLRSTCLQKPQVGSTPASHNCPQVVRKLITSDKTPRKAG